MTSLQVATTGVVSGLANNGQINTVSTNLATCSQGASAPTTTSTGLSSTSGMLWHDTGNKAMRVRNQADTAWIDIGSLDETGGRFISGHGNAVVVTAPQFGADWTGTADSTAAINSALTVAIAANIPIFFPAGTYKVSGTLNAALTAGHNLTMIGSGKECTTISTTSGTADILNISGTLGNYTLLDISLNCSTTRTAGNHINAVANWGKIRRMTINNYYVGLNGLDGYGVYYDIDLGSTVSGANGIVVNGYQAGVYFGNITNFGAGTNSGMTILKCGNLSAIAMDFVGCASGLYIGPTTGSTVMSAQFVNCCFDTSANHNVAIVPAGGTVEWCLFTNCWACTSSTGNGVHIQNQGAGKIVSLQFNNCIFSNNTSGTGLGVFAGSGSLPSNLQVHGGTFAANTNGISLAANTSDVTIMGTTIASDGLFAANSGPGIVIAAGTGNHLIVTNNRVYGNGVAQILDSSTGTSKLISNNLTV